MKNKHIHKYDVYSALQPTKRYRTRRVASIERGLPIALEFCLRNDLASYLNNHEKASMENSCQGLRRRLFKQHERFVIQDMLHWNQDTQWFGEQVNLVDVYRGDYWDYSRVDNMLDVYHSHPNHVNLNVRVSGQQSALEYCLYKTHFNFLREFQRIGTTVPSRSLSSRGLQVSLLYSIIKMTFLFKKSSAYSRQRIQYIYSTRLDILMYFLRQFHVRNGYSANICIRTGTSGTRLAPGLLTTYLLYAFVHFKNGSMLAKHPEYRKLALVRFRSIVLEFKKMGMLINVNFSNYCPLLLAVQSDEPELLELMLELEVDAFRQVRIFPEGMDPGYCNHILFVCIRHGMKPEYLDRILKRHPEWVDQRGHFEFTSLAVAVISKRWDLAKVLLKHGANPNVQCRFRIGSHGRKPISLLFYALHHQYYHFLAKVFMIETYDCHVRQVVETFPIYENYPGYRCLVAFMNLKTSGKPEAKLFNALPTMFNARFPDSIPHPPIILPPEIQFDTEAEDLPMLD